MCGPSARWISLTVPPRAALNVARDLADDRNRAIQERLGHKKHMHDVDELMRRKQCL